MLVQNVSWLWEKKQNQTRSLTNCRYSTGYKTYRLQKCHKSSFNTKPKAVTAVVHVSHAESKDSVAEALLTHHSLA